MVTKSNVILSSLSYIFMVFALLTSAVAIHAAEEIGHPFFQSEDFKKRMAEQIRDGAEIESLQRELSSLLEESNSYGVFGAPLPVWLLGSVGINQFIMLSLISLLLIVLYVLYLKRYNPAKWYLMFKSKHNLRLLFKSMKEFNKIAPLLFLASLMGPSICSAGSTSLFEDVKLFLS